MAENDEKLIISIADSFVKSLSSLKGGKIRQAALSWRLAKLDAKTVAKLLHFIVSRSEADDMRFKPVMKTLIDPPFLVSVLGNEMMSDIYEYLGEKGYYNVRELLVSYPHKKRVRIEEEKIGFPQMADVPLGTKKALAKSQLKHTIDKLIYEEHPVVIRNLLNNSRITEKDVLKIVTKKPLTKAVILEVINSKKWISRHIIKKAVIRNPFTPTDLSLNLLHFMLLQDLKDIAADTGLHYSIRRAAKNMITKKKKLYEKK